MSPTLVVIDLQEVFGDPASEWCAPRFAETLEPIGRLLEAFGADTVFTRFVAPAEPAGAWREYYEQFPFALQPADAPLYRLVEPYRGRSTVDAPTFGKWDALAGIVSGEIVVAGVSTDCCVISTVLAAADAGVRVRVAADACAGATDESHEQALAIMRLYAPLVEVTMTDAVLSRPVR